MQIFKKIKKNKHEFRLNLEMIKALQLMQKVGIRFDTITYTKATL